MTMRVTRDIKQPSGETLNWYWMRRGDFYPDQLILTDESVIDFKDRIGDGNVVYDLPESEYFSNVPEKHGVQYFTFRDWQRADKSTVVGVSPRQVGMRSESRFLVKRRARSSKLSVSSRRRDAESGLKPA